MVDYCICAPPFLPLPTLRSLLTSASRWVPGSFVSFRSRGSFPRGSAASHICTPPRRFTAAALLCCPVCWCVCRLVSVAGAGSFAHSSWGHALRSLSLRSSSAFSVLPPWFHIKRPGPAPLLRQLLFAKFPGIAPPSAPCRSCSVVLPRSGTPVDVVSFCPTVTRRRRRGRAELLCGLGCFAVLSRRLCLLPLSCFRLDVSSVSGRFSVTVSLLLSFGTVPAVAPVVQRFSAGQFKSRLPQRVFLATSRYCGFGLRLECRFNCARALHDH